MPSAWSADCCRACGQHRRPTYPHQRDSPARLLPSSLHVPVVPLDAARLMRGYRHPHVRVTVRHCGLLFTPVEYLWRKVLMSQTSDAPVVSVPVSRATPILVAVLRCGVALMWIQNVAWKVPPDFGRAQESGLYFWASQAVSHPVLPLYSAFVETVMLPNIEVFGWFTLLVEGGLGAFLLIGLATRFWAVVGTGQTLAITLSVLFAPNEWQWSYYLMALAHLAIFATAAGRSYGIDGVLRPQWAHSPGRVARLMMRLS